MHADGFKIVLEEFAPAFDPVKPLCRKLFLLTKDGELDLGTPADSSILYNSFIKAFGDAIAGADADS